MGLDIYLHKYKDFDKSQKIEAEYEKQSEGFWNFEGREYDSLTESEKEEARGKGESLKLKLGYEDVQPENIEIASKKYPDHYFKIGYFRSSYNESGIDRILRNLGLDTLEDVFNPGDEYEFRPNWKLAKSRIQKLIKALKQKHNLRCFKVEPNVFSNPLDTSIDSEEKAIENYINTTNKEKRSSFEAWSNKDGTYHPDGLKIFALIQGKTKLFRENPCTYVITEGDNEWYTQALEIIVETCDYVLSQKDIDKYYLAWSG